MSKERAEQSIPQARLSQMLGIAARVCDRSTIDILESVRLGFGQQGFSISTTNMSTWITLSTPDYEGSCNYAVTRCKQLHAIVSAIDSKQDISLSVANKKLTVAGADAVFKLGMIDGEWPDVPWKDAAETFMLPATSLKRALAFTRPSICLDQTRHHLNGVYFTPQSKSLRLISIDGHQMSSTTIALKSPPKYSVTVPREVVILYTMLLADAEDEEVTIDICDGLMRFTMQTDEYNVRVISRLIDGTFFDTNRIVPYNREAGVVTIDRKRMLDAVHRLNILAEQTKSSAVDLDFSEGKVCLSVRTDQDSAREEIPCSASGDMESSYCLGAKKLISLLPQFDCEILTLLLQDSQSPIILAEGPPKVTPNTERFAIIMPMRR
jgi:DNA polymerase III beta subunit